MKFATLVLNGIQQAVAHGKVAAQPLVSGYQLADRGFSRAAQWNMEFLHRFTPLRFTGLLQEVAQANPLISMSVLLSAGNVIQLFDSNKNMQDSGKFFLLANAVMSPMGGPPFIASNVLKLPAGYKFFGKGADLLHKEGRDVPDTLMGGITAFTGMTLMGTYAFMAPASLIKLVDLARSRFWGITAKKAPWRDFIFTGHKPFSKLTSWALVASLVLRPLIGASDSFEKNDSAYFTDGCRLAARDSLWSAAFVIAERYFHPGASNPGWLEALWTRRDLPYAQRLGFGPELKSNLKASAHHDLSRLKAFWTGIPTQWKAAAAVCAAACGVTINAIRNSEKHRHKDSYVSTHNAQLAEAANIRLNATRDIISDEYFCDRMISPSERQKLAAILRRQDLGVGEKNRLVDEFLCQHCDFDMGDHLPADSPYAMLDRPQAPSALSLMFRI